MANQVKWQSGMAVSAGQYIMPKIVFEPRTIEQEYNGVKSSYKQLAKFYKGAGRFKSGIAIGTTDKGEPITLYVDVRVGKVPQPNKSSDSITQIDL